MNHFLGIFSIIILTTSQGHAEGRLAKEVSPRLELAAAGAASWTGGEPVKVVPVAAPQGQEQRADIEGVVKLVMAIGEPVPFVGAPWFKLPPVAEADLLRGVDQANGTGRVGIEVRRRASGDATDVILGVMEMRKEAARGEVAHMHFFLTSPAGRLIKTRYAQSWHEGGKRRFSEAWPAAQAVDGKFREAVRYWQKWEQDTNRAAAR